MVKLLLVIKILLIKQIPQKEIVQFLVNTDETLRSTYECYQGIINSLKEKDFNKFKSIVLHPSKYVSDKMKQALKLYKDNLEYIENSFKYDINYGIVEGTNNLIKCLKKKDDFHHPSKAIHLSNFIVYQHYLTKNQ